MIVVRIDGSVTIVEQVHESTILESLVGTVCDSRKSTEVSPCLGFLGHQGCGEDSGKHDKDEFFHRFHFCEETKVKEK